MFNLKFLVYFTKLIPSKRLQLFLYQGQHGQGPTQVYSYKKENLRLGMILFRENTYEKITSKKEEVVAQNPRQLRGDLKHQIRLKQGSLTGPPNPKIRSNFNVNFSGGCKPLFETYVSYQLQILQNKRRTLFLRQPCV